jgi:hypothetical protein
MVTSGYDSGFSSFFNLSREERRFLQARKGDLTMADEIQDEEEDGGIKVTDRRQFTADGELRNPDSSESSAATEPAVVSEENDFASGTSDRETGFQHDPVEEPQGVDFSTLTLSLAQSAAYHLGEVPHPDGGKSPLNLEQARVSIDFLVLLKVKCRGNLSSEEEQHLDRILSDLKMLFVHKSGAPDSGDTVSEQG